MGLTDGHEKGPRSALVALLRSRATGWHLRGNDTMRDDASAGADELAAGAEQVRHGHTLYSVTDEWSAPEKG